MQPTTPDLSMLSLFYQADFFVKGIMLLLLFLSVWAWTIWFAKGRQFGVLRRKGRNFEEAFLSGEDLARLYRNTEPDEVDHPMAKVFLVGLREWEAAQKQGEVEDDVLRVGVISRVRRRMDVVLTRELEVCENWLPFLATVGATAPFIGLLGTVWGIMNAFQSIGISKNTSLAIVAPGIAEALLATAMGLFAAIPAVIAYNKLSSELGRYAGRLEAFATEFLTILERREEKKSEVKKVA